ncbi:hypothetical protein HYX10_00550 [Candidatus Woesearchaeota archaeon]|nr:hypothetical protein [Candidatus Woesearchaeota archaeon]
MAKKKRKITMCRDYFGFGAVSILAGLAFLTITLLTTATVLRFFITGFFIALGVIDLALYAIFREKG